jgi:RNA polymerase sigma-70 factor (ECF subfamily)
VDSDFEAVWREHRGYLLDVAYRMLGSMSEAEDIVQEALVKLLDVKLEDIQDVRGWLVVVVSRRCLDQLKSARSRREHYVGTWLPEPVLDRPDPADRVTLDDTVRLALLVVLERLSPAERVVFVLHDVFQFSFDTIATMVGRTPAACRQLASRARRHVSDESSRFEVDRGEQQRVTNKFIAAAAGGDLEALLQILDPEVTGETDGGGAVPAVRHPVVGSERIAKTALVFLRRPGITLEAAPINGEPAVLVFQHGKPVAVLSMSTRDGVIVHIRSIVNPEKLRYVWPAH